MRTQMRQKKRQVTDRAMICAMLDTMETMNVAMHDEPYPYVVPMNFGYDFEDDLVLYFHCAREGYKLELLERDDRVCVSASSFISYASDPVKGHLHDFYSVIARGRARRIDIRSEPEAFMHGMHRLLEHNRRDPSQASGTILQYLYVYRIDCRAEDVTAKAEIMPKDAAHVGFAAPVGDGAPIDSSHVLEMKKAQEDAARKNE